MNCDQECKNEKGGDIETQGKYRNKGACMKCDEFKEKEDDKDWT